MENSDGSLYPAIDNLSQEEIVKQIFRWYTMPSIYNDDESVFLGHGKDSIVKKENKDDTSNSNTPS